MFKAGQKGIGVMSKLAAWLIIVTILFSLDAVVWAQDLSDPGGDFDLFPQYDAGRTAFLANCSVCHGDDGKGGVPRGAELNTKPADLTTLSKNNNGVFSPGAVYKMIDGRETTHRSIDMPIWGCRSLSLPVARRKVHKRRHTTAPVSRTEVNKQNVESFLDLACDPEPIIKARILSIVEYLSHIQEK